MCHCPHCSACGAELALHGRKHSLPSTKCELYRRVAEIFPLSPLESTTPALRARRAVACAWGRGRIRESHETAMKRAKVSRLRRVRCPEKDVRGSQDSRQCSHGTWAAVYCRVRVLRTRGRARDRAHQALASARSSSLDDVNLARLPVGDVVDKSPSRP